MFRNFIRGLRNLLEGSRGRELAPTHVRRLERADDRLSGELTLIERLSQGDCILCVAGEVIPCRGVVVDGFPRGAPVRPGMMVVANYLIVRVEESPKAGRRPVPRAARAHR